MAVPYSCHKCGSTIEEGTPFCPHCGAPQIRVSVPESESPSFIPGTPAEMQPPAEPVPLSSISLPREAGSFSAGSAIRPAIIAGIAIGIGSMIPFGIAWIILVLGTGGALSVAIYHRRYLHAPRLRPGQGAKQGALAAIFGYVLFAVVTILTFVFDGSQMRQELIKRMQEMRSPDPAAQQIYHQLAQKLSTPEGMAMMVTLALAMLFFFFLAIGALGGAIGATLMHRDPGHR